MKHREVKQNYLKLGKKTSNCQVQDLPCSQKAYRDLYAAQNSYFNVSLFSFSFVFSSFMWIVSSCSYMSTEAAHFA